MIHYALVKMDTGEVLKCGSASKERMLLLPELEEPGLELFMTFPERANEETHMLDTATDQWIERPTLPEPSASYDLTALPAGTIVTVVDESSTVHEITDLSETLTLEGPQTYSVKVDPPFPYQRIVKKVEVA